MITVHFNWSPLVLDGRETDQADLPSTLELPQVPRQGEFLDFDDEQVGRVKHVTWDLVTGHAYVYVELA